MQIRQRITRITALSAAFCVLSGCANTGGLGSILGGMLGGGSGQQLSGTVRGVDTRNSQISLQQSDGSSIAVFYDQNTKVVYQSRLYAVSNLENGDQINARIQSTQNNAYYTDSIAVMQSVNGGTGTGSTNGAVQQLQGTVRSVDRNNGRFTIDAGSNGQVTVSMPYRANSTDTNRFNNLRNGDYIRFSGVYLNNSLVELRQFY
jgi:Cu/Ag efflux protein CusF